MKAAVTWAVVCIAASLWSCARPQRSWDVEKPDGFGIVQGATRCGDVLFFADTQQELHRYSFATKSLQPPLTNDQIAFPTALTADCSAQILYLVTGIPMKKGAGAAVHAIDLNSGKLQREYPLPSNFVPRAGATFIPPATVEMSGLWIPPDLPPVSLLSVPAERYYERLSIGVKLSLTTGNAVPVLTPYETVCIGAGECPDVHSDVVVTRRGTLRAAALPASDAIGIYGPDTPQPRRVSVQSKNFLRTGERLQPNDSLGKRMQWSASNSAISQIFAFQDGVVAIHAQHIPGPGGGHDGQRIHFTTYMNTYDWTGTAGRVDLKLTDIPVGRDDKTIFVIDYGFDGRENGATKIRILQIDPFAQGS